MQRYILYYPSTHSLHVSALLGHLQVMITVLDCHTVRCVYIFYFDTRYDCLYKSIYKSYRKHIGHAYTTLDDTQWRVNV
jgi:hypothetical protein